MSSPAWTTVLDLDPDHEYVAMATRFEVSNRLHMLRIMGSTQDLWRALPTTAGLAGYRFAFEPVHGRLSTLTAWRDRSSLHAFVRGPIHSTLVTRTRGLMKASIFAEWATPGADLPPTWTTANARLDASRTR